MRAALALATIPTLAGCGTLVDYGPAKGADLAPGDLIAVGRLENSRADPPNFDPKDTLGHGWFYANFHIERVESGEENRTTISVRYFGHARFREDLDFRFQFRPSGEGDYLVCSSRQSAGYRCD